MKITELVAGFAKPIVEAHGCELWDVEYVREGSEYYLRLYLDKEGGVDINDCEAVSRAIDPILDEKDPIPESYHFEVCSAGLERPLKRPSDFARFLGSPVTVKLYRSTLRRSMRDTSGGPPSAIGLLELSTSEVHAPRCHHAGGGLLHTPSHPYPPSSFTEKGRGGGRLFSSALLYSCE